LRFTAWLNAFVGTSSVPPPPFIPPIAPCVPSRPRCTMRRCTPNYPVLLWLDEQCATARFVPPVVTIHSANAGARRKTDLAVEWIVERSRRLSD
jgi:hypothetical protein